MEKLKKFQTIPFIKTGGAGTTQDPDVWARIGKSTIFDLMLNANIVTNDYIEDESPTDELTYYKPTMAQELAAYKGDAAFDYLYEMFYNMPTGTEAQKEVLIVFAGNTASSESSTPTFRAWKDTATIVLKDFNTVDEKILFDINFGGTIIKGTATVTSGVPTFTPASSD